MNEIENATVMDELTSSKETLKNKLVMLAKQLDELEGLKKSAMKKFNDDIKDLKSEMQSTLKLINQMETDENG